MALLEKNYLLYFIIFCCACSVYADGTKDKDMKYFDKPVKFFEFGKGCDDCDEDTTTIQKGEKDADAQEKEIEIAEYQLYVFVSMEDGENNKQVIGEVKQFLTRHPEIVARGYLIDRVQNLKEGALKNTFLFDNTFTFEFDPSMKKAIEMKVKQVPLVVFKNKDRELLRTTGNFFDGLNNALFDKKPK